jgi:hypothetical protein
MLKTIVSMWKDSSALPLLATFGRDIQLFIGYFSVAHFTNGESDADAAIDAFCQFLQSQKSSAKKAP